MPAPSSEAFARLRDLVALDDPDAREQRPVVEVFTGEQLTTIPVSTAADAHQAIARARSAQTEWAKTSVSKRIKIVKKFRELVKSNREFLMDVAQAECGKSRAAAQEEILDILLNTQYYSRVATDLLAPKSVQAVLPGLAKTTVYRQPKGVVGVISPWNYPMTLSVSDSIPALLAGNAVVVKPDSQTPFCTLAHAELLYRAGLPRDLFAVVPGPGTVVGTAMVAECDYICFTGSTATGRKLAAACGERLIGFCAELGGKNPMIVTKKANLDWVAKAAKRACFANSGQLCISIERIYVEKSVADKFTEKFVEQVKNMSIGADYDFSAEMGSLINEAQVEAVAAHVEDAKAKGATVLAGGRRRPDIGPAFFEPTVLGGVTEDMECCRTETFGPLVAIYPVDTVDEAIQKANDTEYGLNASVWAGSVSEGEAIARKLKSGTVNVDEGYAVAWGSMAAPMGGMKASGLGRRHAEEGLLKYTESQNVAAARIINLDSPFGIFPEEMWTKTMTPLVLSIVQKLPGR